METKIDKVRGKYVVKFTQGVQTFTIKSDSLQEATLLKRQLDNAFKNYEAEIKTDDTHWPVLIRGQCICTVSNINDLGICMSCGAIDNIVRLG